MSAMRAAKPCSKPGCPTLVHGGGNRCDKHSTKAWARSDYSNRKGTTTERGYGWQWQKKRKLVLNEQPFCMIAKICVDRYGHPRPSDCVDHTIPIAAGGTDDWGNLRGSCTDCNEHKSRTTDRELIEAAQRKSIQ
jgi:5-methylcytosine-specific restriction protein A